jgi:hypothetical protein
MQNNRSICSLAISLLNIFALALSSQQAAGQAAAQVESSTPLSLRAEGSFFVGGTSRRVAAKYAARGAAGDSVIDQMYVQYMLPFRRNTQWPIVFVHGCCLSSKTWETTPDGRMGWFEYFVRQGFDTYQADQVGRARSGFDALQYEKVRTGAAAPATNPDILIETDRAAWLDFRWGDYETKTPYADERFPMSTVGVGANASMTFYGQVIPDMNGTLDTAPAHCWKNGSCSPADPNALFNTPQAMATLAEELQGAILVGHSESSRMPTMATLRPGAHGIKAIIQLETGCFANLTPANIEVLKAIPILILVADHQNSPQPPASCELMMRQITQAGGSMTFISLPDIGIKGNSHMMMQDNNNLEIADVIIEWIEKHVKDRNGNQHVG